MLLSARSLASLSRYFVVQHLHMIISIMTQTMFGMREAAEADHFNRQQHRFLRQQVRNTWYEHIKLR